MYPPLDHDQPARRGSRCAALAMAFAVFAAVAAHAEPRLTMVVGAVDVGRGEPSEWTAAAVGVVLHAGDSVRTGHGGRAEVDLGGATTRLFENSLLRLPQDRVLPSGAAAVELGRGDAVFDVNKRAPSDPFEVRTPEIVASVKGTRFAVQLGVGLASVSVFSGAVGVRPPGSDLASEMLVRPGFAAVGSARANFELAPHSGTDPWQGWQENATPPAPPASPTPSAIDDTAPSAVAEAKDAALRASGPEVIGVAVTQQGGERRGERHDEMGEATDGSEGTKARKARRARARAAANGEPDVHGLDPAGLAGNVDSTTPSGTTPGGKSTPAPAVDPVSVADRSGLARGVREQIAEAVLNGGVPGAAAMAAGGHGGPAVPLSLHLVTTGGPNRVVVAGPAGQLAQLTRGDVVSVLHTKDPSTLGAGLLTALAANGVDPLTFAHRVKDLLP